MGVAAAGLGWPGSDGDVPLRQGQGPSMPTTPPEDANRNSGVMQGVIMVTITCLLDLDKTAAQVAARFEARASARASARAAARAGGGATEPLLAAENGAANAAPDAAEP